jgi:hypothetical protein
MWEARAVGPRELSIDLIVESGACGTTSANVTERAASVDIEVIEQGTGEICPAIAFIGPFVVALKHPLAGRQLGGPMRRAGFQPPRLAGRPATVPRVIGFSPRDAQRALNLASLHEHIRHTSPRPGLARVVAQFPAPGSRVALAAVVRVAIS